MDKDEIQEIAKALNQLPPQRTASTRRVDLYSPRITIVAMSILILLSLIANVYLLANSNTAQFRLTNHEAELNKINAALVTIEAAINRNTSERKLLTANVQRLEADSAVAKKERHTFEVEQARRSTILFPSKR